MMVPPRRIVEATRLQLGFWGLSVSYIPTVPSSSGCVSMEGVVDVVFYTDVGISSSDKARDVVFFTSFCWHRKKVTIEMLFQKEKKKLEAYLFSIPK